MKKLIGALLLIAVVSILVSYISSARNKKDKIITSANYKNVNSNISVMELFTSQGCSSCPAADRLMGKYTNQQNVIVLSYHVDYWNRLGWKDPFSNKIFSKRQYQYSQLFNLSGAYTPQLVINGEKEMVGSDEDKIKATLKNEQSKPSTVSLQINNVKINNGIITFNYTIEGDKNNSILNIALIQNKITTSIKAGENSGIDLTNFNVVRSFKQMPATNNTGTASIDLVQDVDKTSLNLVAFLQNATTFKIGSATKASL